MKTKSIICLLTIIFASMFMSLTIYGATSLYVGDVFEDEGYVVVPVYFSSTEYDNLMAYEVQVMFDANKIDYEQFDKDYDIADQLTYTSHNKVYSYGTLEASAATIDEPSGMPFVHCAWASSTAVSTDEEGSLLLFELYFLPNTGYSASSFTSQDFAVKIYEIGPNLGEGHATAIQNTSFSTYVVYNVPKEVPEDWEYGYIKAIKAIITDSESGDVLTEEYLNNYEEIGDNYSFIVNLSETTEGYTNQLKSVVNVEFVGTITDAEDGTATEDVTLETLQNVEVEYMAAVDRPIAES